MNVFELQNNLVDDYSSSGLDFVNIRCPIKAKGGANDNRVLGPSLHDRLPEH